MFNIDGGYLEGLCRGFKCGILKQSDYLNLVQCETLEGKIFFFRSHDLTDVESESKGLDGSQVTYSSIIKSSCAI